MKNHMLSALKLTFISFILLVVIYPGVLLGIALFAAPNNGGGDISNVGQAFISDKYFNSRPSAVSYNGAGSGGSNKGPSNPAYLSDVQNRIEDVLKHNPEISREEIPSDLVTASGSGLDPHISQKAALVQVKRIARIRQIPEEKLVALVHQTTQKPLFGLFGPETVHVVQLNKALDKISK